MKILLTRYVHRASLRYDNKKLYLSFINTLFAICLAARPTVWAMPIQVVSTAGSATYREYPTLSSAFIAINNGTHTGAISINIVENTTEGVSAVLNASGTGSASYTSVNIQPSGGGARTISGSIAGTLIDLNGADNITIDGLNSGGNSLIIDNPNTGTAYTIQARADATFVTIKRCTVKGASNVLGATVFVSTSTSLGNDNFWVDDCDITASSTGNPVHGLLFDASNTDNTKVTNSRIYDFYSNLENTYGIRINELGMGCDITGNSFYQTASRIITKNLYCVGATSNAIVANLDISNNYFGGQTIGGGSSASPLTLSGVGGALKCISLIIGSSNTASLQNNQIKNIRLSTTGTNILISLATGSFGCGNLIGNSIGDGIIRTTVPSDTVKSALTCILVGTGMPKDCNISNNIITGCTADGGIKGIQIEGAANSYTVNNNFIYNLNVTNGSTITGIFLNSSAPLQNISKNYIYNFTALGSGDAVGIDYNLGGTNTIIQQNKIYNFTSTNLTYGMAITGINVAPPSNKIATFSNNVIVLGNNISKRVRIYGFQEAKKVGCNYYNNSVYIGGTISSISGTVYNSYAFYSVNDSNTLNIKNNVFINVRSNNTGTAKNYSIQLANNSLLTIDNNLYYGNTASNSGYQVGRYNTTDCLNLCNWKTALGTDKETNSIFKDPKFINPTASTPDLHIQSPTPVEGKGVAILGVTTDFDGEIRSSIPDIGADEGSFTFDPQVTLAALGGPYCFSDAPITLSGGVPSGGTFSGMGVSGTTFTPSAAGAGTVAIAYTYNNGVDICNVVATQNITVHTPSVGGSILGSSTVCSGTNNTVFTLNNQTGNVVKWQSSTDAAFLSSVDIENTTTNLMATDLAATTYYRAVVQSGVCVPTNSASATVLMGNCATMLSAKVFIEGAYNTATNLMNDGLRSYNKIPLNQPYNTLVFPNSTIYTGSEKIDPSVLTITGDDAIVDWLLVELRSASNSSNIVQRRAALLQRDGDIVDIDGVSAVKFDNLIDGNYHIVIRHRLCLPTRTQTALLLTPHLTTSPNPTVINFTSNNNTLSGSQKRIATGKYGLFIGDINRDGRIDADDMSSMRLYNPMPYDLLDYLTKGYDVDFNGHVFSSDISIVKPNNLHTQVDLGQ